MKRLYLFIVFLLIAVFAHAQYNSFVYFRYDQPSFDNWALIQRINKALENADQKVMFFENRIYEGETLDSLLLAPHFLTSTSIYNPEIENQILNDTFSKLLKENIGARGKLLHLEGEDDRSWSLTFLLGESSSLDELAQLIDVNNLLSRAVRLRFLVYSQEGEVLTRTFEDLFKNQIKNNIISNNNEINE